MKHQVEDEYMKPKDLENDYEAQQINEYYNWKPVSDCIDDPEEIRWMPVAKKHVEENEDVDFNFLRYMTSKGLGR